MEGFENYGGKNVNLTQYSSSNKGGDQQWSAVPETKCHQSLLLIITRERFLM